MKRTGNPSEHMAGPGDPAGTGGLPPSAGQTGPPATVPAKKVPLFGRFMYPGQFEGRGFSFCIDQEGDLFRYRRQCDGTDTSKIIAAYGASLFIHPVEPVNLPKEVTRFLEIEFPPVMMEPESEKVLYLTFPVEIGVILHQNDEYQLLDVFSQVRPKYSLYGTPESGVITRHYRSGVFDTPPETDPEKNGLLTLSISNTAKTWVEVGRAVFESMYMPIYFGNIVAMSAEMKVYSRDFAETRVLDRPPAEGMQPAIPVITGRKILLIETDAKRFLMEHGVR